MEIVNKVAQSGLISLDLEEFYDHTEKILIDLKDQLFQGLILREKDFRDFVKNHDWRFYQDKYVAIFCTADAIVPIWAYMLVATAVEAYAKTVIFGNLEDLENVLFRKALSNINPENYRNAKVVVKGCSHFPVPISAYVEITRLLRPVASSIMYGEPCSTVPIFKKTKA